MTRRFVATADRAPSVDAMTAVVEHTPALPARVRQAARRTVAVHSTDAEDCQMLLAMLGLDA